MKLLKSIYKDSGKYAVVYGVSFVLILIIALTNDNNNLNIIEKLNTTGQIWKVFLFFAVIFSLFYIFDKILKKVVF